MEILDSSETEKDDNFSHETAEDVSRSGREMTEATRLHHSQSLPTNKNAGVLNSFSMRSRSNVNNNGEGIPKPSSPWNISNVEQVSPFFHIPITHCIIHDLELDVIAKNISDFIVEISESVIYDDDNAIAHVEMGDNLRIQIRLFKAGNADRSDQKKKNDDKTDGEGILVEVSRRCGCSVKYHYVAMKILDAANGKKNDNWNIDDGKPKPLNIIPPELKTLLCVKENKDV
mmetsp:Transcript_17975/g.22000  ORF Transcript_17975/g.22000 Transcript_17975/m.22000 type:complete len:230 (+) Transcript_17975:89-778(+)